MDAGKMGDRAMMRTHADTQQLLTNGWLGRKFSGSFKRGLHLEQPRVKTISLCESDASSSRVKTAGDSDMSRTLKDKLYFIKKLRRKQESRTKILIQRLKEKSKAPSLFQTFEKARRKSQTNEDQTLSVHLIKCRKIPAEPVSSVQQPKENHSRVFFKTLRRFNF